MSVHRDTNASGVFGLTYIFQQCLHDLPEFVPVAGVHPGAPHASQNLRAVLGLSLITWKGSCWGSVSHWVTAAASLPVSLLSRSLLTIVLTLGSTIGRNLHNIPNIEDRSP